MQFFDLAMKKGIPIATLDKPLISVAKQSLYYAWLINVKLCCRQEIAAKAGILKLKCKIKFEGCHICYENNT